MCYRFFYIVVLLFLILSNQVYAEIECEDLKPSTGINTNVENHFKGEANVISKKLGSGKIENIYKKTEENMLHKLPSADQMHLKKSLIYLFCELVKDSTLTDNEKLDWFFKLNEMVNAKEKTGLPKHETTSSSFG